MKFQTIIADCLWWYADRRLERKDGGQARFGYGAGNHYDQMKTDVLCSLDVQSITADRCHLYLWATMPLLPDAMRTMAAWGFEYKTGGFVWIKLNPKRFDEAISEILQPTLCDNGRTVETFLNSLAFFGPGFYTGSNIELVLLGIKAKSTPFAHADGCKASQVVFAPLSEHSAKPEEVQRRIEWMHPDATLRLEMFARRDRPGWICVGNEAPGCPGEDIRESLKRLERQ